MPKAKIEDQAMLLIIKENQPISIYKLAKKLNMSYSAIYNKIVKLERDNKVVTEKKPKGYIVLVRVKEEKNE